MAKTTYYQKNILIDKTSKKEQLDMFFDLINAFSQAKTPMENALLLQDLLTAGEIKDLSKRLRIAKLILKGSTQREVSQEIHCSVTTVTKVSLWLESGGEGIKNVIKKIPHKYSYPDKLPPGPIEYHLPSLMVGVTEHLLAENQDKKINELGKIMDNLNSKSLIDKSLRDASSKEFIAINSEKKIKKFIKLTSEFQPKSKFK
jgi:Trp operon repressor